MAQTPFRSILTLALVAFGLLTALPGRTQGIVLLPTGPSVDPGQTLGGGQLNGYGPPGFPQEQQPGQQRGGQQTLQLPEGVDTLYALEGDNSLVIYGTPAAYSLVRALARSLDGDLDIIRTQVALAKVTRTALPGRPLTGNALTAGDVQKLLAARLAGDLPTSAVVRVTTREETEVNTSLGLRRGAVPVTFIPRLGDDGRLVLQFTAPLTVTLIASSGTTTALALPPPANAAPEGPFFVLFITPSLLTGDARR